MDTFIFICEAVFALFMIIVASADIWLQGLLVHLAYAYLAFAFVSYAITFPLVKSLSRVWT